MTFADSVLHLVRARARIDSWTGPNSAGPEVEVPDPDATDLGAVDGLFAAYQAAADALAEAQTMASGDAAEVARELHRFEPGLSDLEAAVGLVSSGLAKRVVLSGFKSWPGLLWRAYQLAETTDVLILPTVVRPGGKVDIVITRDAGLNG